MLLHGKSTLTLINSMSKGVEVADIINSTITH